MTTWAAIVDWLSQSFFHGTVLWFSGVLIAGGVRMFGRRFYFPTWYAWPLAICFAAVVLAFVMEVPLLKGCFVTVVVLVGAGGIVACASGAIHLGCERVSAVRRKRAAHLQCPHCSTGIKFGSDYNGLKHPCPTCGNMLLLQVPPTQIQLVIRRAFAAFGISIQGLGMLLGCLLEIAFVLFFLAAICGGAVYFYKWLTGN